MNIIKQRIADSIETKQRILADDMLVRHIETAAMMVSDALKSGGKILLCGNGGSASDALHIAGEIVGRFQKERKSYPAIALNADDATMTAIAEENAASTEETSASMLEFNEILSVCNKVTGELRKLSEELAENTKHFDL